MGLHSYSVTDLNNTDERYSVLYRLAVVAGLIGTLITGAIGIATEWGASTSLGAPSTIVIYLFLVRLLEKKLWKNSLGKLIGVVTPDLNGTWNGFVNFQISSGELRANPTGILTIEQTWRTIGIGFRTDRSRSHTNSASIIIQANEVLIVYQFFAQKTRPEIDRFEDHIGTGMLRFTRQGEKVFLESGEASYYAANREVGRIDLKKISDVPLPSLSTPAPAN